eukprot:1150783-Pelagomonas_calceolata.AAC.2
MLFLRFVHAACGAFFQQLQRKQLGRFEEGNLLPCGTRRHPCQSAGRCVSRRNHAGPVGIKCKTES